MTRASPRLFERLADGTVRNISLGSDTQLIARAGARYYLVDSVSGRSLEGLLVKRKGNALVIEQAGADEPLAEIAGFYEAREAVAGTAARRGSRRW